ASPTRESNLFTDLHCARRAPIHRAYRAPLHPPRHLLKGPVIILADRPHPPVPPQKIKPKIPLEIMMMLVMRHRCIHPAPNPTPVKPTGIELKSQMPIDIKNKAQ